MEFKIGDRVKYIEDKEPYADPDVLPTYGTVKCIRKAEFKYGVEWDEDINGHSCNDNTLDGHGWFCRASQLELVVDTHYQTDIQPIEVMQANMTHEELIGFLKGNIIKYVCRCGRKDAPSKEAAKINQYSKWLVEALEGRKIDPKI